MKIYYVFLLKIKTTFFVYYFVLRTAKAKHKLNYKNKFYLFNFKLFNFMIIIKMVMIYNLFTCSANKYTKFYYNIVDIPFLVIQIIYRLYEGTVYILRRKLLSSGGSEGKGEGIRRYR